MWMKAETVGYLFNGYIREKETIDKHLEGLSKLH